MSPELAPELARKQCLPLYSIGLLSASALATELYLVRLFAIIQWQHAAYMIISLALLGYGVSGTLLALVRKQALARFTVYYPALIALFSLVLPLCLWLVQHLDFNAELLLWQAAAWLQLATIYLLLALPFLFAAAAIGLALDVAGTRVTQLYAADLAGAGLGALGLVALLSVLSINNVPPALTTLALLAVAVALLELRQPIHLPIPAITMLIIGVWLLPADLYRPQVSEFKPLSETLRIKGARLMEERSGPLGLLSMVQNNEVPLRHAPGLSLHTPAVPGQQLALFGDASGMSAIIDVKNSPSLTWLEWMPSALPYVISEPHRILIAGAGGGMETLQALKVTDAIVDVVEPNRQRIELLQREYSKLDSDQRLQYHHAEVRAFLQRSNMTYDLIVFGSGGAGGGASGMHALNTQYAHTIEAYREYLDHLAPTGRIAITSWLQLPPRGILKHIATAIEALKNGGNRDVSDKLLVARSLQTTTLLFGTAAFEKQAVDIFTRFNQTRGFDTGWQPGMQAAQANRFNRLPRPWIYEGVAQLLGVQADRYIEAYKFDIRPATDDQPYFTHYFRWSLLNEILANRGRGGMSLVEGGYLVLLVTLIQAVMAGALLILLPLALYRRQTGLQRKALVSTTGYFLCLGLAFLFMEIAFIERLTLLLGHPLYSIAVVLTGFLVFAGIGSAFTSRLVATLGIHRLLWLSTACIIAAISLHLMAGDWMVQTVRAMPEAARVPIVLLLIAPLAIPMGVPFPLGLGWLATHAPAFTPWAWGLEWLCLGRQCRPCHPAGTALGLLIGHHHRRRPVSRGDIITAECD